MTTARSLDGGQTWPDHLQTEFFDFRAAYAELEAGRRLDADLRRPDSILFSYVAFNWERPRDFVAAEFFFDAPFMQRCFVIRSPDRGRTWETRPIWVDHPDIPVMRTFSNFLRRSDGVMLLPARVGKTLEEYECVLFASDDGGEHWVFYAKMIGATGSKDFYTQPFLIELPDSSLLATIRHQGSSVELAWTLLIESTDGGRTWSAPRRINDYGAPAPLVLLTDTNGRRYICDLVRRTAVRLRCGVSLTAPATRGGRIVTTPGEATSPSRSSAPAA